MNSPPCCCIFVSLRRRGPLSQRGDVYARDDFTYWGFPAAGLGRLGQMVGLDDVEIIDEVQIDGHPRIIAVLRSTA